MITSAIKKQTSVCCSISSWIYKTTGCPTHCFALSELRLDFIKSILWYSKLGITEKKGKKESNSIVSLLLMSAALPIAPFICEHCL